MTLDQQPSTDPLDIYAPPPKPEGTPIRLNLGSGPFNRVPDTDPRAFLNGYTHVDARPFIGVDVVHDLGKPDWPWADNSVDEVYASHFVEHLRAQRYSDDEPMSALPRVVFVNELYRVLKPGGKATIITPAPFSERAYGDLTHCMPAVTGFWSFYLAKAWRDQHAPHSDFYTCNFHATWGYGMHQDLLVRNQEFQQFALQFYKEAAQDIHQTWIAVK